MQVRIDGLGANDKPLSIKCCPLLFESCELQFCVSNPAQYIQRHSAMLAWYLPRNFLTRRGEQYLLGSELEQGAIQKYSSHGVLRTHWKFPVLQIFQLKDIYMMACWKSAFILNFHHFLPNTGARPRVRVFNVKPSDLRPLIQNKALVLNYVWLKSFPKKIPKLTTNSVVFVFNL